MNKEQIKESVNNLLTTPLNAGRAIVESEALIACPLLGTNKFVRFCRDRGFSIDAERLTRFERLGMFNPIFRVKIPNEDTAPFYIPIRNGNNWFKKGWATDTADLNKAYAIPDLNNQDHEAYYSIFQIDHLSIVLSSMII